MGMKAGDQNAVPLCPRHHRELHMRGDEYVYFEDACGDQHAGKLKAMELWYKSPVWEKHNGIRKK